MTNYVWERRKQDKIDYKRYEKMLMAFVFITTLTGIGVGILGMVLAVLG